MSDPRKSPGSIQKSSGGKTNVQEVKGKSRTPKQKGKGRKTGLSDHADFERRKKRMG